MPQTVCPFCEAKNNVAPTAAGRTVRCQSCQTMFLVPMDVAEQAASQAGASGGSSTGPAVPTGPRVPTTPAKSSESAPAVGSPNAAPQIRPAAAPAAATVPAPLPCGGVAAAPAGSPVPVVQAGGVQDLPRGSSGGNRAIVFVVSGLACLALAAALLAVLFVRLARDKTPGDGTAGETSVVYLTPRGSHAASWADASRGIVVSINDVAVRVDYAGYGAVRAKNEQNEVIVSDQSNYLQIYLDIKNHGPSLRNYTSWYGQSFLTPDGEVAATVVDDQGRQYEMTRFTHVHSVKGHTPEAMLADKDSVKDVVIFEIPEGVNRAAIHYFQLELPAACYGGRGVYRFEIPAGFIQDFR